MARIFRNIFVPDRDIAPYLDSLAPDLPFVVRVIQTRAELELVAHLRLKAYRIPGEQTPEAVSRALDQNDIAPNSLIFGAFDKFTNQLIGSIRIAYSTRGATTMLELARLPGIWAKEPHAEARLLCIPRHKYGRMILLMMCKVFVLTCRNEKIHRMIVGARPSMEPFYRLLCFDDVDSQPLFFAPPGHSIKHRVLGLDLDTCEDQWIEKHHNNSLRHIIFTQKHRDLRVPDSGPLTNPLTAIQDLAEVDGHRIQTIASLVRGKMSGQS